MILVVYLWRSTREREREREVNSIVRLIFSWFLLNLLFFVILLLFRSHVVSPANSTQRTRCYIPFSCKWSPKVKKRLHPAKKKRERLNLKKRPVEDPKARQARLEAMFSKLDAIAELRFLVDLNGPDSASRRKKLAELAVAEGNTHVYAHAMGDNKDKSKIAELTDENDAKLKKLKEILEDAEANHGETEVYESTLEVAHHFLCTGEKLKLGMVYQSVQESSLDWPADRRGFANDVVRLPLWRQRGGQGAARQSGRAAGDGWRLG